jgi:hypothetical protein
MARSLAQCSQSAALIKLTKLRERDFGVVPVVVS